MVAGRGFAPYKARHAPVDAGLLARRSLAVVADHLRSGGTSHAHVVPRKGFAPDKPGLALLGAELALCGDIEGRKDAAHEGKFPEGHDSLPISTPLKIAVCNSASQQLNRRCLPNAAGSTPTCGDVPRKRAWLSNELGAGPSLCLQSTSGSLSLPGSRYVGAGPAGFATREDVSAFIAGYWGCVLHRMTMARVATWFPWHKSRTLRATRSHPRSLLLSMLRLNSASSRTRLSTWRRTGRAQKPSSPDGQLAGHSLRTPCAGGNHKLITRAGPYRRKHPRAGSTQSD